MRILITRPFDDSQHTARELAACAIDSLIEPLFTINFLRPVLPSHDFQAVIFTSRHAARDFVHHYPVPHIPAFCVGDETASALGNAPFSAIYSADGDAIALHRLICDTLHDKTAPVLRLHADLDSDPLYDMLTQDGYDIARVPFYNPAPVAKLSATAIKALQDGILDGICFYSPNAARHFSALLELENLTKACRGLTAWCISKNTQAALHNLPFERIIIADHPTHQAMVKIMTKDCE